MRVKNEPRLGQGWPNQKEEREKTKSLPALSFSAYYLVIEGRSSKMICYTNEHITKERRVGV